MSSLFLIPLFLGQLAFVVGTYAINRGENLAEREKVGGYGTYLDRTGFLIRCVTAVVLGIFFLILAISAGLSA